MKRLALAVLLAMLLVARADAQAPKGIGATYALSDNYIAYLSTVS